MKVEKVSLRIDNATIIRRTNMVMERPSSEKTLGSSDLVEIPMDEEYDFTQSNHRMDILERIVSDVIAEHGYAQPVTDWLMKEMETAIRRVKESQ